MKKSVEKILAEIINIKYWLKAGALLSGKASQDEIEALKRELAELEAELAKK